MDKSRMIADIKEIVEETLYRLDMYSDDALALIMRTGWAESGYRVLRQYKGPAIGFWQVELATAKDTMVNYVNYRPEIKKSLESIGLVWNSDKDFEYLLLSNIAVQAAFCRLKYRRDSKPIPSWDDLEAQAKYWKRVYNTELGEGTVKHFIDSNQYK